MPVLLLPLTDGLLFGLALGADTALHRGGLDAHGILIGVLPTSLEKVYPSQNRALSQSIIDTGGCLISEYPLGDECFASTSG